MKIRRTFIVTSEDWYAQSGTRLSSVYEREATGIYRRIPDNVLSAARLGELVVVRRPTRAEYEAFMLPWFQRWPGLTPITEFHVPEDEEEEEEEEEEET